MTAPVSSAHGRSVDDAVEAVLDSSGRRAVADVLDGLDEAVRVELAMAIVDEARRLLRPAPARALRLAGAVFSATRAWREARVTVGALRLGGQALVQLGRIRSGLRMLDRALRHAVTAELRSEAAHVQVRRMEALAQIGRYDDARDAGGEAWLVFDELDDPRGQMQVDVALGNLAVRLDRYREGLKHLRRARSLTRSGGNARVRAILDVNVAVCLEGQQRYRAAARHLSRARAEFDADGLADEVAQVDANRAHLAFVRGRFGDALDLYLRAEETFRRLDQGRRLAQCHVERAELLLQMAMPADARELAR